MAQTMQLDKNEVGIIQRAHAQVQALEEMYRENMSNAELRSIILNDLGDAKLTFERTKDELIVSKLPADVEWSLDYASGVVTF